MKPLPETCTYCTHFFGADSTGRGNCSKHPDVRPKFASSCDDQELCMPLYKAFVKLYEVRLFKESEAVISQCLEKFKAAKKARDYAAANRDLFEIVGVAV